MAKEIKCTILKTYGAIKTKEYDKDNYTTKKREHHIDTFEIRIISWNDAEPVVDIGWWTVIDGQAERCTSGGRSLNKDELEIFQFAYDQAVADLDEVLKNWKAA